MDKNTKLKKINKGKKVESGQITGEDWVRHFSCINSKDPSLTPANFDCCNEVKNMINNLKHAGNGNPECHVLDRDFSVSDIVYGIKRLKRGKATAFDAITNDILRASSNAIAPTLANMFNKLAFFRHFPKHWSLGLIITIHKSGDTCCIRRNARRCSDDVSTMSREPRDHKCAHNTIWTAQNFRNRTSGSEVMTVNARGIMTGFEARPAFSPI